MSFIYARKYNGNKINVYADNKFSFSPHDESMIIKSISQKSLNSINTFGVIKNVIINKNICIAAAGVLEDFNDLLKYVDENHNISVKDICIKANEINKNKNFRTDFIICTIKEKNEKIFEIKNGSVSEVNSSWIGVYEAFNKFQSTRIDFNLKNGTNYSEEGIDIRCFKKVLSSRLDDSIGENIIDCYGTNGSFSYGSRFSVFTFKSFIVNPGEDIIFPDSVEDGGYTYYIYESCDDYKIYIKQLQKGIIFTPCVECEKYNHLRLPKIVDTDIKSFEKNFNCSCFLEKI